MMSVQPRQRWKSARLSDPISQTNCTPGWRATMARRVSTVQRVPARVSKSEMIMAGPTVAAAARAEAIRSAKGAVSWADFSGFCGETSQTSRSSPSRCMAVAATWAWPSWAGLNEPPNRPTFIPGARSSPSRRAPRRRPEPFGAGPAWKKDKGVSCGGRRTMSAAGTPYAHLRPNTAERACLAPRTDRAAQGRFGPALEFLPARPRIALARLGQLLAPGQHHEGLVAADLVLADHGRDGAQGHAGARVVEKARELGHAHAVAVGVERHLGDGDDVQALIDRHPHVGDADHPAQLIQRQGPGAHLEDGVGLAALTHDGVAGFRQGGADGAQRIAGVFSLEIGFVDEDARALGDGQGQP